jgi:tRNA pseudouridine55 synthase
VRAGHIGSLDPLATGMLPICLGEATKIAGVVLDGRKCYSFTIALGGRSSTGDAEGDIVETASVPMLTEQAVHAAMAGFLGQSLQVPPMYSAIKQQGQALYKLARAGVTVERAPRRIEIFELRCLAIRQDPAGTPAELDCRVVCGKGTYVRTLAEDLAVALCTVGRVTSLRRDWVEPFSALPMITLEALQQALAAGLPPPLIDLSAALPGTPRLRLAPADALRFSQGQRVACGENPAGLQLVENAAGQLLGLADCDGAGELRPKRLFTEPI